MDEISKIDFYEVDLADPVESIGLTPEDLKVGDLSKPETLSPLQLRCKQGLDAGRIVITSNKGYLMIYVPAGCKVLKLDEILPPGSAVGTTFHLVSPKKLGTGMILGNEYAGN